MSKGGQFAGSGDRAWHAAVATLERPLGELPDPLEIPALARAFDASVRPPGSKSLTNRLLLLAALARGESVLRDALVDADDARVMMDALRALGSEVEASEDGTVRVRGVSGRWKSQGRECVLNLNNAGTATRFLTAAALLGEPRSSIVIDGNARMRERPIGELVDALNGMTSVPCAEYVGTCGYPPVRVTAPELGAIRRGPHAFGRMSSSQFVSAVMLIAPFLPSGLEIEFTTDDVTSRSYIDMTAGLMRSLGFSVAWDGRQIAIEHAANGLAGFSREVEADASGATYFQAAAAMTLGSRVRIEGLDLGPRGSLQGDAQFVRVLTSAGASVERGNGSLVVCGASALRPIDEDLSDMPDTAMTAAVLAASAPAGSVSVLRGLRTLRVKETDRLAALVEELAKVGARAEVLADNRDESLRITSGPPLPPHARIEFDTYDDHRMAMALSLFGLHRPGVFIRDPACVRKTYPSFYKDLHLLYQ